MAPKKIPQSRILQHFLSLPENQRIQLLSRHLDPEKLESMGGNELYFPMTKVKDMPEKEGKAFINGLFRDPRRAKDAVAYLEDVGHNFLRYIYSNINRNSSDLDKLYAFAVDQTTMPSRLRMFYQYLDENSKKTYLNRALSDIKDMRSLSPMMNQEINFRGRSNAAFLEDIKKTMDLSKEKSTMDYFRDVIAADDPEYSEKMICAA